MGLGASWPEKALFGALHLLRNHVTPYRADWYALTLWLNNGLLIATLLFCLLIGLLVAFLAKGNELVATMTLSLLLILRMAVLLPFAKFVTPYSHPFVLPILLYMFDSPVMLILVGWIVRDIRLARYRKRSYA
jgi:hypothetical protein